MKDSNAIKGILYRPKQPIFPACPLVNVLLDFAFQYFHQFNTMSLKLGYFGHVKVNGGLERALWRTWFLEGKTGLKQHGGGYRTLKSPWT